MGTLEHSCTQQLPQKLSSARSQKLTEKLVKESSLFFFSLSSIFLFGNEWLSTRPLCCGILNNNPRLKDRGGKSSPPNIARILHVRIMNAPMDDICYFYLGYVCGGDLLITRKIRRVVGNMLFSKVVSPLYLFINRQTQY